MVSSSGSKRGAVRPALWSLLLASTSLPFGATAFAQDAAGTPAPEKGGVETVVVTAQKRLENVQKVPISIQALSTKKLTDLKVQSFNDYVKFLPSVTFAVGGGGGTPTGPGFATVTMRGVASGGDGNHSGPLPTVGIYLDEQPITTVGGSPDLHIYDIARVESLAGPQGTLYGASSEAGTLRIITNKPNPEGFSAGYDASVNTVEHGGVGYTAEGFVNVPLADNAAIRIVGWDEHDAGYIDNVEGTRTYPVSGATISNVGTTARNDYNFVDTLGGRAALQINLDDSWTITPSIVAQQTRANGSFGYDPSIGDLKVQHYYPEYAHDKWYQAALTVQGKIGNLDLTYSGGHMVRVIHSATDYTDYSFFYDTLYGYGAYIYNDAGVPINPSQHIDGYDHFVKDSHELRIATPADERLRFVGGLFYERQTHFIDQEYRINGLAQSISIIPDTIWLTLQKRVDRDYAAFGELSYDITPDLTLTGGVRGFIANNSLKGFFGYSAGYSSKTGQSQCFDQSNFNQAPCINLDKSIREEGATYKINLTYKVDPDKIVYATASSGFRPGGINRRGTVPPYQADHLYNYEIGAKTSWLDHTLQINGAAYIEDWSKFQFAFLGLNSFTEIHNAADARVYGLEGDVIYKPIDGLTLSGAVSYNEARLRTDYCGAVVGGVEITECPGPVDPRPPNAPKGTELPTTPKYKLSAVARYEWNISSILAHVQGSMTYQSSSWPDLRVTAFNSVTCSPDDPDAALPTAGCIPDPLRSVLGKQAGFATFDFTAGVDWNNVSVELFVTNAFDERANLFTYVECNTSVCGAEPYRITNQPRTIGIKIGQHFG